LVTLSNLHAFTSEHSKAAARLNVSGKGIASGWQITSPICEDIMNMTIEYVTPWRVPRRITTAASSARVARRVLLMKRLTTGAGVAGVLGVAVLGSSGAAAAAPSGFANFGNAQDTVNALSAAG
jgi:hypothetical protein